MQLFDTHCHLDASEFALDREQVLQACRQQGVRYLLLPAVSVTGFSALLAFCSRYEGLYPALGLHPVYVQSHRQEDLATLAAALKATQPVAVGEIGLDFWLKHLDQQQQIYFFEEQLKLAQQFDLPVILHIRKAHDQVLACLKRIPVKGGICHAFNGSLQQAEQFIARGFKLGFGGTLTYTRSNKIRALAAQLPVTALVLETDAPDIVVASHHGERNSPEYLPDVLQALTALRAESAQQLAVQTTQNAFEVLGLL